MKKSEDKDKKIEKYDSIYDISLDEILHHYPSVYDLVIDASIQARHIFKDVYRVDDYEEPFLTKNTEPIEKPTLMALMKIKNKYQKD